MPAASTILKPLFGTLVGIFGVQSYHAELRVTMRLVLTRP
jgi:hypothetical protein